MGDKATIDNIKELKTVPLPSNWYRKIRWIAGNPLEPLVPKCKNLKDWAISSRASFEEGSTTIQKWSTL
jgi:hypothetical protein